MSKPIILYIEDNQDNRKLVSRVLAAAGFDVKGVADGQAALAFVETHTPDLILMDINLPQIDGYTMTARMRRMHQLSGVPIIALTANVMREDQERCYAVGCNGFIRKPVNIDRLPDQVRNYLNQSSKAAV